MGNISPKGTAVFRNGTCAIPPQTRGFFFPLPSAIDSYVLAVNAAQGWITLGSNESDAKLLRVNRSTQFRSARSVSDFRPGNTVRAEYRESAESNFVALSLERLPSRGPDATAVRLGPEVTLTKSQVASVAHEAGFEGFFEWQDNSRHIWPDSEPLKSWKEAQNQYGVAYRRERKYHPVWWFLSLGFAAIAKNQIVEVTFPNKLGGTSGSCEFAVDGQQVLASLDLLEKSGFKISRR